VQAAASQARGKAAEAFQSLRSDDTGLLATAARETERWGVPAGDVPDVPNTATDPTGDQDPWQRQESRASRMAEQYPAEERHW
jgi:hypothetical protein